MTSKKLAMLKRWIMILAKKNAVSVKQGVGSCYSRDHICGYYNDLTAKVCENTELDENGIPLTTICKEKKVYFPISIFQYGLGCYDLYLMEKKEVYLKKFLAIVKWTKQNICENGSWDCFQKIESKKYNVSSMCQAEGASLLYRAYVYSQNKEYLILAESAIDFMLKAVEDGGTTLYLEKDLFFEEYPQIPRRTVLNGWIFSIFGLYDAMLENRAKYEAILKRSLNTLKNSLCDYDIGYWSRYDLLKMTASPAYHDLHISQLQVLYQLTNIKEFDEMANKFEDYRGRKKYRYKAILIKVFQKLFEKTDAIVIK